MYADTIFHEEPRWSRQPGQRLALNLLPATLIVLGGLALLRLPDIEQRLPLTELIVHLLTDKVEQPVVPPVAEETPAEVVPEVPTDRPSTRPAPVITDSSPPTDWLLQIPEAAYAVNDSQPREYSVNPGYDEKREVAAVKFAPSRAPVEPPIWENIEKDTLGRTLLRSGDCYKVIDDPNVGSRDAFLVFGQFMTMCAWSPRKPQLLPWVRELQSRREGLARYGRPTAE